MDFLRHKRIVQTFYLLLILFIPLLGRLADVQLNQGPEYARKALEQRSVKVVLEDIPRGNILDRQLNSLLGSGIQNRIVIFPSLMTDTQQVITALANLLQIDTEEIAKHFAGGSGILPYEITEEQERVIKEQNWAGVMVQGVHYRYLNQPLAVHLTGHVGKISSKEVIEQLSARSAKPYRLDDLVGKMGLEQYYEQELKANEPQRLVRAFTDATGTMLVGMGLKLEEDKVDLGRKDIVTTLDRRIQQIVETVMDEHIARGAVVVMDVHTGDILAMASRPNFNPADVSSVLPTAAADTFIDHCTALYHPGSIFKIVVAAAALEEGLVNNNSTFVCLGEKSPLISCWHPPGHGPISFEEAFAQSCNPVFAELACQLGAEKLIHYAKKLGLANQQVIGYPVPVDKRQDLNLISVPYNLVNSSIGQWPVMATPVQVTALINTIVNQGNYLPPRVVRELRTPDGTVTDRFLPGKSYRALSQDTAQQLQYLMTMAVEKGLGWRALVPELGSAGKTGSAEIAGQQGVNAWFAGYAPLERPRYAVTILVEQGDSGGESAAPVFKEIMSRILIPGSVD